MEITRKHILILWFWSVPSGIVFCISAFSLNLYCQSFPGHFSEISIPRAFVRTGSPYIYTASISCVVRRPCPMMRSLAGCALDRKSSSTRTSSNWLLSILPFDRPGPIGTDVCYCEGGVIWSSLRKNSRAIWQ
jgi:hypothetical protein